ncbi:hypothetical protein SAMN05216525_16117 [Bradyrhizobium sp. Gha]|nr:hypothetical protein SAMN05216525_16117 [Bradyrhizobium sp. Gha]
MRGRDSAITRMGQRRVTFLLTSICSAGAAGTAPIQSQNRPGPSRARAASDARETSLVAAVMLIQAQTPGRLVPREIDGQRLRAHKILRPSSSSAPPSRGDSAAKILAKNGPVCRPQITAVQTVFGWDSAAGRRSSLRNDRARAYDRRSRDEHEQSDVPFRISFRWIRHTKAACWLRWSSLSQLDQIRRSSQPRDYLRASAGDRAFALSDCKPQILCRQHAPATLRCCRKSSALVR